MYKHFKNTKNNKPKYLTLLLYIILLCICVCVLCVEREREREPPQVRVGGPRPLTNTQNDFFRCKCMEDIAFILLLTFLSVYGLHKIVAELAATFGKTHKHVLDNVRRLDDFLGRPDFRPTKPMFVKVNYTTVQNRTDFRPAKPIFLLTSSVV